MAALKTVLVTLGAGVSLAATTPKELETGLKFRLQQGTTGKYGVQNGLGLGLNVAIPVATGQIGIELGYQYYSGDQYRDEIPANAKGLTPANSVQSKKCQVNGIVIRTAFIQPFAEDWNWHAGLAIGRYKSRQEAVATFTTDPLTSTDKPVVHGAWAFVADTSSVSVSPFVGVDYKVSESGVFELNLLLQTYKQANVAPSVRNFPSGGFWVDPVMEEKSVTSLKVELTYAFRF